VNTREKYTPPINKEMRDEYEGVGSCGLLETGHILAIAFSAKAFETIRVAGNSRNLSLSGWARSK
jgi:hypothetical protein